MSHSALMVNSSLRRVTIKPRACGLSIPEMESTSPTVEAWDRSAPVTSIACSPDGWDLAATTRDGKLWLDGIGLQRSVPFMYLVDRSAKVANARFSPDGQSIATTKGSSGVIYNIDALREFVDSSEIRSLFTKTRRRAAGEKNEDHRSRLA